MSTHVSQFIVTLDGQHRKAEVLALLQKAGLVVHEVAPMTFNSPTFTR